MDKLPFFILLFLFFSPAYAQNDREIFVSQLLNEKNNTKRIQLIFQLAETNKSGFSSSQIWYLKQRLLRWYEREPDPGLHSAIDYLSQRFQRGGLSGAPNWDLSGKLNQINKKLSKRHDKKRMWFITPQGQTMSKILGPVTFMMGSPETEKYRTEDELAHQVTIPRSFAVSTKEITVAQFQSFLKVNPLIKELAGQDPSKAPFAENERLLVSSPESDCPQIFVTWYEATQYCNWLSQLEGLPESEWCYPPNKLIKSEMEISHDYLKRKGYRLPTEAEWEYIARGGSATSHFWGESEELLSEYAWYSKNPPQARNDPRDPNDPQHTYPVGQLKPNPLGIFDIYGNVWEWCDTRRLPYPATATIDETNSNIIITDSVGMVRRGGSFAYGKETVRSAHRGQTNYFPNQRRDNVGFRVARTIK
jgi:formylglycine-generating enzyme required for sulfatase activity